MFFGISQNSQENSNFIKEETLAQLFSHEFCEHLFYRTPLLAASEIQKFRRNFISLYPNQELITGDIYEDLNDKCDVFTAFFREALDNQSRTPLQQTQPAITCSKLTIETSKQGEKERCQNNANGYY